MDIKNFELMEKSIIEVLIRFHTEVKEKEEYSIEYIKYGIAISNLLKKIEKDFGIKYMIYIFKKTCNKLECLLNPLDQYIIKKLYDNGFQFNDKLMNETDENYILFEDYI